MKFKFKKYQRKKLLRLAMKTFILIFCIPLFSFSTSTLFSQNVKVVIPADKTVTVDEVFDLLRKQTNLAFIYQENIFDNLPKINLKKGTIEAKELLKKFLSSERFEFELKNKNTIIIKKLPVVEKKQQQIKGKVTDRKGMSLPGANISEKGTGNGTQTDADGNFTFALGDKSAVLVVSFVGFNTQEITVGERTSLSIVLEEDAASLDGIVVVGYGTTKRSDLTGSVSSIKASDLPLTATASITSMLAGKASGVAVTQTSAQPGGGVNIVIRGSGSLDAGNEPLYVIDGFPVNNNSVEPGSGNRYQYGSRNPLNSINPNDVESIEILKDASSTAIYGARAANGVVIITTKRGSEGKLNIDFSARRSVQAISNYFEMLDAKQFMEQTNRFGKEFYLIRNGIMPYGLTDPEFAAPFTPKYTDAQIANAGEGTDWWDEVTRSGKVDEYNFSLSGGTAKTKYLFSLNHFGQDGVVYNSDFKRLTARFNFDQQITDKIRMGLSVTRSDIKNGNIQLGEGLFENSGVLLSALEYNPAITIYDAYGNYSINPNKAVIPNPVSYREINDETDTRRMLANAYVEADIVKGLKSRVTFGVDDKESLRSIYLPTNFLYGAQTNGQASKNLVKGQDYLFNATLSYNRNFTEDHSINALLGYEYQEFGGNGFGTSNTIFFTDNFGSNNLGAGEGVPTTSSYKSDDKLASYFTRLGYSFKNRYLINFTLRRDGTTNFGENKKWGVFPSAAVAWKVSEEEFLENNKFVSALKLRMSYGQTGNSNIGNGANSYYGVIGSYLFGNNIQKAVGLTQLGNANLSWETTTELNLGLDFGFFENRISGSAEYYNRTIDDLLTFRTLPAYSTVSRIADNVGSTKLYGFELELKTRNLIGDFKWTTNFNIAANKNRWKSRNSDVILSPWQSENDPIRAIYGYRSAGIVQIGQVVPHMPNALPGNIIYQDLNGYDENNKLTGKPDGIINSADNVLLGSSDPGMIFGLGNTFEYKGFDLNVFFYGMSNRILFNGNRAKYVFDVNRLIQEDHNQSTEVNNLFTSDKPSTTFPGIAPNPYGSTSDFDLEDAAFLRLRNVTLGYTLPKNLLGKNLSPRIYFDAQNLWTSTKYSGIDPESDSLGGFPNQKTYTFGININF